MLLPAQGAYRKQGAFLNWLPNACGWTSSHMHWLCRQQHQLITHNKLTPPWGPESFQVSSVLLAEKTITTHSRGVRQVNPTSPYKAAERVCQNGFWSTMQVSSSQRPNAPHRPNTPQVSHNHPCAKTVSYQVFGWAVMKCFERLSLARIKNNISTSFDQHLSMKSHWASTPRWHMLIS